MPCQASQSDEEATTEAGRVDEGVEGREVRRHRVRLPALTERELLLEGQRVNIPHGITFIGALVMMSRLSAPGTSWASSHLASRM